MARTTELTPQKSNETMLKREGDTSRSEIDWSNNHAIIEDQPPQAQN